MTIKKELDGKKIILKLEGRLDTTTAPTLEKEISDLEACEALILDLKDLQYLSSAGLRVLLVRQNQNAAKGAMILRNVCESIMDVFEMTGFLDILTIEK